MPGSAMHIMSRRITLLDITIDTLREMYLCLKSGNANSRDFSSVPPYFGFSLPGCLGWSVSWNERICFMNFACHFLKNSLLTGENEARERGGINVQLAKAHRFAMANYLSNSGRGLGEKMGLQRGFMIAVHRTSKKAEFALKEAADFGEDAELLTRTEAVKLEPNIANLPMKDPSFVLRKHDQAADCAEFIRDMIRSFRKDSDISYVNGTAGFIEDIKNFKSKDDSRHNRFRVVSRDGTSDDFDQVILAAGIYTPLFAGKISRKAGQLCPIFPLKGYSLTLFTETKSNQPFLRKGMSLITCNAAPLLQIW